jgi:organic radical activating enzyme
MTTDYNIIGTILFSQSLNEIRHQLESLRKDRFDSFDRIIIKQDVIDEYPYIDAVGTKLIEIQKIVNSVDISNCFILLITANTDIASEINFVTEFYSIDKNPIEFQLISGEYKKQVKKYHNTACKKLWNHLYIGTDSNVNPCCIADHRFPLGSINSVDIDEIVFNNAEKIRSNMLQGYRNRACAACYEKEDNGITSARQLCDPVKQTVHIKDIDIRLNNICNFKCRMCSEYFSSAIQQETIELYGKTPVLGFEKISLTTTNKQTRNQQLKKILSYVAPELESIYFAGGEPLIMSEHYEMLNKLISIQNTNLSVRYNTNISKLAFKDHFIIDYWRHFKTVNVGASIDASNSVAEYIRHGTVWKDIVANINTIKQCVPHVKLQITSTVGALNIENLMNLQIDWIDQHLFCADDFQVSVMTAPNYFSSAMLPQHHKHRLSKLIQHHISLFKGTGLAQQWQDVLQWMNNNDYTFALNDFKHRTKVLDQHRNESFVNVFPQFKDLIE